MKAYVGITGLVFALVFAAHVARILAEGTGVLAEPLVLVSSLIALCLCLWSLVLLIRWPR